MTVIRVTSCRNDGKIFPKMWNKLGDFRGWNSGKLVYYKTWLFLADLNCDDTVELSGAVRPTRIVSVKKKKKGGEKIAVSSMVEDH